MWDRPFSEMMSGWSGWAWPFMGIVPLLVVGALIAVLVLVVRNASDSRGAPSRTERRSPGLDALDERYARGDLNRDEYLQKRRDIVA